MTYFGGKAQEGVYQTIINQMPLHRCYIEPFLGGGAVMIRKIPAETNIGLDLDAEALAMFSRQFCLEDLTLLNRDAITFLSGGIGVFTPETLVYCDPPYLHSTRSSCHRYNCEMTDEDHISLLRTLNELDCMVMISTYPNHMYETLLAGWRRIEYTSVKRSGNLATEYLYMNYDEPVFLHDDRYLGTNANNRQDINRRIARTNRRLMSWPRYERMKTLRKLLAQLPHDELSYLICSIGETACFRSETGDSA